MVPKSNQTVPEKKNNITSFVQQFLDKKITNPKLYQQAFRHKSASSLSEGTETPSYERLEFLGDAVLDLIVSQIIFDKYNRKPEGFLTKLRSSLVKGAQLARFTKHLGLEKHLITGERVDEQAIRQSIGVLADIFEAFVGAVYLDQGYEEAFTFVEKVINKHAAFEDVIKSLDNYKSLLLEYTQAVGLTIPTYKTISEKGPDHNKTFEIAVFIGSEKKGTGTGKSKKKAEQMAARIAFEYFQEQ